MESYSVQAVLSVTDKNFTSTMAKAAASMSDLDSDTASSSKSVLSFATAFSVAEKAVSAVANVITNSLSSAISRVDTLNQYPKIMEQMGYSSEEVESSIKKLSAGINGLPTSLDTIVASAQSITLLTGDLDSATDTALALNDAFYVSGASSDEASRGLTQYTQMLSKGSVDMQSWKTLQETMSYALSEAAKELGIASGNTNELYDALQSGEITFDELNAKIIELDTATGGFAEVAQTASGGIATSFQNLQTAVVKGLANMITAFDDAAASNELPTIQEQIEGVKDGVNKAFAVAENVTKKIVSTTAPAIKMVSDNLDILVPVLGTAAAGFVTFKAAIAIQDKVESLWKKMDKAVATIKNWKSAAEKAAEAQKLMTVAQEAAEAAATAQKAAEEASKKALQESQKYTELYTTAIQKSKAARAAAKEAEIAKTAAEKAGRTSAELNAAAEEKAAAAVAAKTEADAANAAMQDQKAVATAANMAANDASTAAKIADTGATELNTAAKAANAGTTETLSIATIAQNALLGVMSGEMSVATAAQWALNAAMEACPVGAMVVAISAIVTGVVALVAVLKKATNSYKTQKEEIDDYIDTKEEERDAVESTIEAREEDLDDIEDTRKANRKLVAQIESLMSVENKDASQKAELAGLVDTLNDSVEGLNLEYDEEEDKLNRTTQGIRNKIDAYALTESAVSAEEGLVEVLKEEASAQDALTETQEKLAQAEQDYADAYSAGKAYASQMQAVQELKAEEEEQKAMIEELGTKEQEYRDIITQANEATAQSTSASTSSQRIDLENLSETQEEVVDHMVGAYETMTNSLSDLTSKIEEDDETTWASIRENQQDTIAKTQEFADLYSQLIQAGVSESYLEAIGATGPESIPLLQDMLNSGIDEVLQSQSDWEDAYDSVAGTFTDSLALSDEDKSTIKDYILGESGVYGTMQSALEEADFAELGESMTSGTTEGITESADTVSDAAAETVTDAREAAGEAIGEGSPATSFIELAQSMIDGLVVGLSDGDSVIKAAASIADDAVDAVESAFSKADFSKVGKSSFSGIETAAKSSMANLSSTITSGVQKAYNVLEKHLKQMVSVTGTQVNSFNKKITAAMNAAYNSVYSGVSKMYSAMNSGMDKVVSVASSGSSKVTSAFSGLDNKMYTIGVNAMQGFINGMNAKSGSVMATARTIANSVATTISNALKVGSPSKVTEKIGKWTGVGLVNGLEDMISATEKASNKLAEAMVPATVADFSGITQRFAYAGEVGFFVNSESSDNGMLDILQDIKDALLNQENTYNFEASINLDGKKTGYGLASYVQEKNEKADKIKQYISGSR